mgnify:CR=1 FL=1
MNNIYAKTIALVLAAILLFTGGAFLGSLQSFNVNIEGDIGVNGNAGAQVNATVPTQSTTTTTAPVQTTAPATTQTAVAETFKDVQTTSTVAGVKSEVVGSYLLQKGVGVAITSKANSIAQSYGFAKGETPYAKVLDMDIKKSDKAKASLDFAAQAYGAENVAYLQMELGKMSKGQYTLLPGGVDIEVSFSIPKEALDANATYAVIRVVSGGEFTVLEDTV